MSGDGNAENPWFGMQQALLDESLANVRRMAALPGLLVAGRAGLKRGDALGSGLRRGPAATAAVSGQGPVKHKTPLLFVFALVNRPYILDILPNKSVVGHFVQAGFDTYLIDWGKPTFADRHLNLNSYINGYLGNVVKYLQKRTPLRRSACWAIAWAAR